MYVRWTIILIVSVIAWGIIDRLLNIYRNMEQRTFLAKHLMMSPRETIPIYDALSGTFSRFRRMDVEASIKITRDSMNYDRFVVPFFRWDEVEKMPVKIREIYEQELYSYDKGVSYIIGYLREGGETYMKTYVDNGKVIENRIYKYPGFDSYLRESMEIEADKNDIINRIERTFDRLRNRDKRDTHVKETNGSKKKVRWEMDNEMEFMERLTYHKVTPDQVRLFYDYMNRNLTQSQRNRFNEIMPEENIRMMYSRIKNRRIAIHIHPKKICRMNEYVGLVSELNERFEDSEWYNWNKDAEAYWVSMNFIEGELESITLYTRRYDPLGWVGRRALNSL